MDTPFLVSDWMTGYQSDGHAVGLEFSRIGHPVGLVSSRDWVTGPTDTQPRLGLLYFKIHKFFLAVQSRSTVLS